jgi:hypothetical protein
MCELKTQKGDRNIRDYFLKIVMDENKRKR